MHIENVTDVQALEFVGGVAIFALLVLRFVPGTNHSPARETFREDEIKAYDRAIPKYFLAAALALVIGGAHTVIKNVPGFWEWLWEAGYGGHLFRDLSNSHIIIVGGGTILLTGITWYVLPRIVRRPLYSDFLTSASFWLTLSGLLGFYVAWVLLGLVEGEMVRNGWDYLLAKDYLGNLHKLPTAISASIMGFGYWAYVLNVFLTVIASRRVEVKPLGVLTKFIVISASGLFIGTVQGVIQVLPANADWIRAAGKFGEYIDPISHAHVNLVTGVMVSLAAFLVYFAPRMGGIPVSRSSANRIFWVLVPGSIAFYLAFLLLGLVLGGATIGEGGIQVPELVPMFQGARIPLLALSGSLMLLGFWIYFVTLWQSLHLSNFFAEIREATPAAFWLVSSVALVIGTFQGMLQVIPATASILTIASEIPNIHAQLNMIGGVILALIGVVYVLMPELVGTEVEQRMRRWSLWGISGGIGSYYLMTLITGFLRLSYLQQGLSDGQAADRLGWGAPLALMLTAVPMFFGYLAFGIGLWRATPVYRREWLADMRSKPERYNGGATRWQNHFPIGYFLGAEAVGAFAGFPGLGWIMSGRPFLGVPMAMGGPMIAWGVIPILMSPFGAGPLAPFGLYPPLIYLSATTILSVTLLTIALKRSSHLTRQAL